MRPHPQSTFIELFVELVQASFKPRPLDRDFEVLET
jgi:hypothetical protein